MTEDEIYYLINFERKDSNFYGLPKTHKSKEISERCKNSDKTYIEISTNEEISFWPIVAGPVNETHRLSNLIDVLLKSMTKHVRSCIRDSTDFLNKLPSTVSYNSFLVAFDVQNLYNNITHELGLEAIEYWLNKHPEEIPRRINHGFIKRGIKFILVNNNSYFNWNHYNQVKGIAVGTNCAPTYATFVLSYLEERNYKTLLKKIMADNLENTSKTCGEDSWTIVL